MFRKKITFYSHSRKNVKDYTCHKYMNTFCIGLLLERSRSRVEVVECRCRICKKFDNVVNACQCVHIELKSIVL